LQPVAVAGSYNNHPSSVKRKNHRKKNELH